MSQTQDEKKSQKCLTDACHLCVGWKLTETWGELSFMTQQMLFAETTDLGNGAEFGREQLTTLWRMGSAAYVFGGSAEDDL